jgi:amino acid transporter
MEKERYTESGTEAPPYDDPTRIVEDKGIRMGEAADMYGDLDTAEEYGYVARG